MQILPFMQTWTGNSCKFLFKDKVRCSLSCACSWDVEIPHSGVVGTVSGFVSRAALCAEVTQCR
jgi:hypothetical protein